MPNTITAMFDNRADAEAAKERLMAARVDADNVHVHDQSSSGYKESSYSNHQDRGFWDSIKNAFVPDEDRHTYEEGVRRGGVLLAPTWTKNMSTKQFGSLKKPIRSISRTVRASGNRLAGTITALVMTGSA